MTCDMVWAGAEGADFWIGASGVDVAKLLAFVAANWFVDVFAGSDFVTKDKYMFLEEGVSLLRGGTDNLKRGEGLVGGVAVDAFEPMGSRYGVGGEAILFLDER